MKAKTITYWVCQIAGWGIYSAIGLSTGVRSLGWRPSIVAGYGLFFVYSILLTHALRYEIRRRKWLSLPVPQSLARIGLAAIFVALVQSILVIGVNWLLEPRSAARIEGGSLIWIWMGITGVTVFWSMLYACIALANRYRVAEYEALRLQLALKESELRALEAQVNPHFLFNCLNTIRGMIVENPAQAQDMVTQLAEMMRYSLDRERLHTVPLARELEAVSNYLALEEVRFEDRLRVRYAIDPEASGLPVPTMMLQTLVENAVKHGIAPRPGGGEVFIRAGVQNGTLALEVENTGHLEGPPGKGTQTGLRNVRERLRLLYGDGATVTLTNQDGSHVRATVMIPRRV